MEYDYEIIGARLRQKRKELKMSQENLGVAVGVGTTHISHIETGNSIPSLNVFLNIINTLNTSSDEILGINQNNSDMTKQLDIKIASCLSDCSTKELEFLKELLESSKQSLRKNRFI